MKRLKTPLRSTMSDERLSSLTVLHVHKHKEVDVDQVISEFAGKKDRRLSLCLSASQLVTSPIVTFYLVPEAHYWVLKNVVAHLKLE